MEMEETAGNAAHQMSHIFNLDNVAADAIHIQQPQPPSVNMSTPTTSTMASIRGRSKVWQNFTVTEDGKKVRCNLCGDSLSYSHSHSTSSMLKHLKRKHNMDLYPMGDDDSKGGRSADKPKKAKSKKASQQQQQQQQQFEPSPEEIAEPSIQHGPLLFTDPCVRMRWTDHSETFLRNFSSLYTDEAYTDVTLVADKQFFKAHRVILSSASEFFDEMFKMTPSGQHPIIFLKDIKAMELRILLDFIYKGEVAIPPTLIPSLVKVGGEMKVKGLSEFIWNDSMASTVFQGYQTGESRSPLSQSARAPSPIPMTMPMQTSTTMMASKLVTPVKTVYRHTSQPVATSITSQSPSTASLQRSYSRILSNVRTAAGNLNTQTQAFASSPVAIPPLKRIRILSNKHQLDNSGTEDLTSCTGSDDLTTTLDDGTGAEIRVTVVPQSSLGLPLTNDLKTEHDLSDHGAHMHSQHMSHPISVLQGSSDGEGQDIEEVVYSITEVQGGGHEVMMTEGDGEQETIVVYGTTADHSPVDKKLS